MESIKNLWEKFTSSLKSKINKQDLETIRVLSTHQKLTIAKRKNAHNWGDEKIQNRLDNEWKLTEDDLDSMIHDKKVILDKAISFAKNNLMSGHYIEMIDDLKYPKTIEGFKLYTLAKKKSWEDRSEVTPYDNS